MKALSGAEFHKNLELHPRMQRRVSRPFFRGSFRWGHRHFGNLGHESVHRKIGSRLTIDKLETLGDLVAMPLGWKVPRPG
jgi:hypothetical protein